MGNEEIYSLFFLYIYYMATLKKTEKALDILKNYNGENPYILMLKRDMFVYEDPDAVGDFQIDYILRNVDYKPKIVNRITKIPEWYGLDRQEKWGTEFTPKKLLVLSVFGETDHSYSCYVQYRQSVKPTICFLPKKAIINNLFVEDYTKLEIDFDRYDRLSTEKDPNRKLKDEQKTGVQFLLSRKKCILADQMGLGKTTTLSVAAIEGNFDSVLIICPATLKINWKKELMWYVDEKYISIIDGFNDKNKCELEEFLGYAKGKSNMKKEDLLKEAKEFGKWKNNKFVIINYEILDEFYTISSVRSEESVRKLVENNPLLKYIYNRKSCVIVDEAHRLSDRSSNTYKVISNLIKRGNPESIYLATGTPVTNNPLNLYNILSLIENEITADYEYYINTYCEARKFPAKGEKEKWTNKFLHMKGKNDWFDLTFQERDELKIYIQNHARMITTATGASNLDELKEKISHIYLRRTKENLDLPPKHIHEIFYDLTFDQKMEYDKLWDEYEKAQKAEDIDKELNKELLEGGIYRRYLSNLMVPNTIKLCNSIIEKGNKCVIGCCYDDELDTLREYYGDKCVHYNGKVDSKRKDKAIEKFMHDDSVMVFIGNIRASGVGITLIKAHDLIFNNIEWTYSNNSQMEDRIHRIGQTHECDVYYQIFRDTQYEHMWDIVLRKQTITESLIKKEGDK